MTVKSSIMRPSQQGTCPLFKVSMVNRQGLNVMPSGMFVKFQNAR
jgi:hypothetical protein